MGKTKEHPRTQVISMRVTDDEKEMLEVLADKEGISIDSIIRSALVEQGILKYRG